MYGDPVKLKKLAASLPGENKVVVVEGADHFFVGKLDQVDRAIAEWMIERISDRGKRS
jgi:alpha/beta superfamily hydrolase